MRPLTKYGELVRRLRKERGWSQLDLGVKAGVDQKTIIQVENGKRNPTLKTLQQIAAALKVPLQEILG